MSFSTRIVFSLAISFFLVSCGSDDPERDDMGTPSEGVFIDSPVSGIAYYTSTFSGKTDEAGRFNYTDGETVQFSIGDIELPATRADFMVHVSDIFGGTTSDIEVINLARLLLTLDSDNDPENGINLSAAAFTASEGVSVDFSSATFEDDIAEYVTKAGGATQLISEDVAKRHIEATLKEVENYTSEEEDAALFGCGEDCVARASYHEYVDSFYPRHQQVNVPVNAKIQLTLVPELTDVPGSFFVELFPLKTTTGACRIDWGGFTCGDNESSDAEANWEFVINGTEYIEGTSNDNPVVFGVSGAQADADNNVTIVLAETLTPGVTYMVHVFNDDEEFVFKTWWYFTT